MLPFQELPFHDLGGIQTKKALQAFNPRDAFSCVGGHFDVQGAFMKRMGGEKYNTTALSSYGSSIYDFKYNNDANQKILITSGTDINDGSGGFPVSIKSGLTSGTFPDWETFQDHAWFVNGADDMMKYDGTTVTNAGIARPITSPTVNSINGAGTLSPGDVFLVAITYVNSTLGIESNPCDEVQVTIGGGHNTIQLTNIPVSPDSQVDKRYVYVTTANGSVLFFYDEIPDNNPGSIIDIENVNNLGALLEYDHDAPPSGLKGIEFFKNRLFGFKDNQIYYSKAFDTWYWPQGELDQEQEFVEPVGNSPINGMKAFFDVLLIFLENDIYVLSGEDELTFRLDRLRSDERVGCVSDRTIQVIGNYCYFLARNSVYRTNGITVENVGKPTEDFFSEHSESTTYKINKNYIDSACSAYDKNLNLYLIFLPTAAETNNNMCYALDTLSLSLDERGITNNWIPWPGFTTMCAATVVENGVERWWRADEYGYIFRQNRLNGDGSNITSTSTGGNTLTTLNDTNLNMTVNLYAAIRLTILKGTGAGQERIITSNTATEFTINKDWETIPDDTSVYSVGGIPYHYAHNWNCYDTRSRWKRLRFARPHLEVSGDYDIEMTCGFDFNTQDTITLDYSLNGLALWDSAIWDVDVWDGKAILKNKYGVPGNRIHIWNNIKIENNAAGQPIKYMGVDKLYQMKGYR